MCVCIFMVTKYFDFIDEPSKDNPHDWFPFLLCSFQKAL